VAVTVSTVVPLTLMTLPLVKVPAEAEVSRVDEVRSPSLPTTLFVVEVD